MWQKGLDDLFYKADLQIKVNFFHAAKQKSSVFLAAEGDHEPV